MSENVLIFILGRDSQNPTALLLILLLMKDFEFISLFPSSSASRSQAAISGGIMTPVATFESENLSLSSFSS